MRRWLFAIVLVASACGPSSVQQPRASTELPGPATSTAARNAVSSAASATPVGAGGQHVQARFTDQAAPGGNVIEVEFSGYPTGSTVVWESWQQDGGSVRTEGREFVLGASPARIEPGALLRTARFVLTFVVNGERVAVQLGEVAAVPSAAPTVAPTPAPTIAPTPAPTPVPTPLVQCGAGSLPPPAFVRFTVSSGLRDVDVCDIQDGLARANRFMTQVAGGDLVNGLSVLIATNASGLLPAAGSCCIAYASGALSIAPDDRTWSDSDSRFASLSARHAYLLTHEYFHVYQGFGGCQRGPAPAWWIEGSADFIGLQMVVHDGIGNGPAIRAFEVAEAARSPVTLQALENGGPSDVFQGTNKAYNLGYLATERLVGRSGYAGLQTFCTGLRAGLPAAFQNAFGMSLTAFYADFEQWRSGGFAR